MNESLVDQVASAVLYEGYMLYPYRPSVKNRQRWTFGGLYPRAYSEAHGGTDAWTMQTECLVQGGPQTTLDVTVRFLHLMARQVGELAQPLTELPDNAEPAFRPVECMQVEGKRYQTWQEAVERQVPLGDSVLEGLIERPRVQDFAFPAQRQWEPLRSGSGDIVAVIVREQQAVAGAVELSAAPTGAGLFRVTAKIVNLTPLDEAAGKTRDDALLRALVSTHTMLGVRDGAFVSLLDPPESCRALAAACRNVGTWPVLIGTEGQKDTMLSSPIILYDYPQIAPESPGDLFDGTEIDEILTLRILTLTDEEKAAAAAVDERARALLNRTEALAREQLLRLHGTVRGLRPVEETAS
jgi:hypothetical protein